MTQAERIARHDAAIARFNDEMGPAYAAWLAAQPVKPRTPWIAPANDNEIAANDNFPFEEAA